MSTERASVVSTNPSILEQNLSKLGVPDIVLQNPPRDGKQSTDILKGFVGGGGYTIEVVSPDATPKRALDAITEGVDYYTKTYPEEMMTIYNQPIDSHPQDDDSWKVSVWTNYGEDTLPYQKSLWEAISTKVHEQRGGSEQDPTRAISYVRLETPFAIFGFEPGDMSKGMDIATSLVDTKGFEIMFSSLIGSIDEASLKDFLNGLKNIAEKKKNELPG